MKSEKERLIEAIECVNREKKELLNSREYKLGSNILKIIEYLKRLNIKAIHKKIVIRRKTKKDKKFLSNVKPNNFKIPKEEFESVENKRIVVYTCITGNYDNAIKPLYNNDNVDYIILTNNDKLQHDGWQEMKIDKKILDLNNNVLINRYIKMHPAELFASKYDYAIYIDGNIRSVSDLSKLISYVNDKTGLALHRHQSRDCIYVEEKACELYGKGKKENLRKQVKNYKKEGFPENFGMLECNVVVTDLNNNIATNILNAWWKEFISSDSRRDQLSLPYVLWKNGFEIEDVGCLGTNVNKNDKIEIVKHN